MFRFSKDVRFPLRVSFTEFQQAAVSLSSLITSEMPSAEIEVITCEDADTYNYSTVTFMAKEVTDALENRKRYQLEELTKELWDRSYNLQLTIRDPSDRTSFMVTMSVDRLESPRRLQFYGQVVSSNLKKRIEEKFKVPSLRYSIGDGYTKPSLFDFTFGQKITGLSLR